MVQEDERKRKSNNVSSTSREIKATDQTNNHGNPLSTSAVEIKSEISNGKHSSRTSRSSRSIGKSSIRKGLNFILKKQQQFEEKMSKKLEETIQSSQMIEKQIQELKQKELEIQLEMLKRSQEEMRKRNLELEYELRTAKNNTVFESSSPTNPMYYFPREQSGRASQTKYVPNISPSTRKAQSHRESTGTNTNQIQKAGEAGSTYVFDAPQGVESKDYQRTVQSKKSSLKFPQNGEDLSEILMDNSELMNQIDEEDLDGQGLTSDNQDPYLRAKSRDRALSLNTQLSLNKLKNEMTLVALQKAMAEKEAVPKRKKGKYFDPSSRKFKLDFSVIERMKQQEVARTATHVRKREIIPGTPESKSPHSPLVKSANSRALKIGQSSVKQGENSVDNQNKSKDTPADQSMEKGSHSLEQKGDNNPQSQINKHQEAVVQANHVQSECKKPLEVNEGQNNEEQIRLEKNKARNQQQPIDAEEKPSNDLGAEKKTNDEKPVEIQNTEINTPADNDDLYFVELNRKISRKVSAKRQTFGLVDPIVPRHYQSENQSNSEPRDSPPITRLDTPKLRESINFKNRDSLPRFRESLFKKPNRKMSDQDQQENNKPEATDTPLKRASPPLDVIFDKVEYANLLPSNGDGITEDKSDPIPAISHSPTEKKIQIPSSLSDLLEIAEYLQYPEKTIISKQVALSSTYKSLIECTLDSKEKTLTLTLKESSTDSTEFKEVKQEKIRFSALQKILNLLDHRDSLPSTVTLKSIKTYTSLVQHVIMAFVGVRNALIIIHVI